MNNKGKLYCFVFQMHFISLDKKGMTNTCDLKNRRRQNTIKYRDGHLDGKKVALKRLEFVRATEVSIQFNS